ncbi:hypothetical protein LNN83_05255 [Klebsiella pneumoniae subsp. pneumoniae]|nr:hypothetical protein [Klebsiella pneumoniae subsp. pneumoniae]
MINIRFEPELYSTAIGRSQTNRDEYSGACLPTSKTILNNEELNGKKQNNHHFWQLITVFLP